MSNRRKLLLLALATAALAVGSAPAQAAVVRSHSALAPHATLMQRELAKLGYQLAPAGTPGALPSGGGRLSTLTPNDPYYLTDFRWALDLPDFPDAWSLTTGDPKTVIAIIDTGVDPNTPDLQGALLPGWDFVNNDSDPSDDNGHGTAMASLAAARINNGIGIAGACGACSILPVKVANAAGFANWTAVAAGVVWATDQGARIISISLAGADSDAELESAIAYAQGKGAVVFAAAGNNALGQAEYPAALPGVISVEATDQNDNLYSWSNHGPTVTLSAPGCAAAAVMGGDYSGFCGTSVSTPLVAGAAGLLLSYQPTLTAAQISTALEQSADRVGDSQFGRLDVYRALLGFVGAPASVSLPTISGYAILDGQLAAASGSWSGSPATAVSYQWLRCSGGHCINIAGANGQTYTVSRADLGRTLEVTTTAANPAGHASATSLGFYVKAAPKPVLKPKAKAKVKVKVKHPAVAKAKPKIASRR
jgi:subtilisin family serine protease